MKISKVNHRRTAVGTVESGQVEGMLYRSPAVNGKVDFQETFDDLNNTAKRLYSPFDAIGINRLVEQKVDKKDLNNVERKFKQFVIDTVSQQGCLNKKQKSVRLAQKRDRQTVSIKGSLSKDELVDQMVDGALRKSLSRTVSLDGKEFHLPDIAKKLVKAVCFCSDNSQLKKIDPKELYVFFSRVQEDREKNVRKQQIEKSLKNQNVRVQGADDNAKKRVQLSAASSKKKKPLADFLTSYACADKERQKQMLLHVRKLIVLFACGEAAYHKIKDKELDVWNWENYEIPEEQLFIANGVELLGSKEKKEQDALKTEIRNAIIAHYKEAVNVVDGESDRFWIQHFENAVETLFKKGRKRTRERMKVSYLCEYLWKEWFPYVASKYVDLGKGVYHFAMPQLSAKKGKEIEFGVVDSRYNKGITSFDYERIKAEETLERNLATHATFATNIFAKAVVRDDYRGKSDANSDVLQYADKEFGNTKCIREDAVRRVMQYYGGQSRWCDVLESVQPEELLISVKKHISAIRNRSFHYTSKGKMNMKECADDVMQNFFEKDYSNLRNVYASKYYSNNALLFYSVENVCYLMRKLYSTPAVREAQIPAFHSIIKRGNMKDVVDQIICEKNHKNVFRDAETAEKYCSTLFFMLKEIYYYDFLQAKDLKTKYISKIKKWGNECRNNKEISPQESYAKADFVKRVLTICKNDTNISFGGICQMIMTDYNMQNQGQKSIRSLEKQNSDKKIGVENVYQHFPILLHNSIRELFIEYINPNEQDKKEVYRFIREPHNFSSRVITLEEFCEKVPQPGTYEDLKEIANDPQLLDWYVLCHFLTPKQLNLLIGDIKNYIQFIQNIDKRAQSVRNRKGSNTQDMVTRYGNLHHVMEFVLLFVGRISNNILDYFNDADDYAAYLSRFVDFRGVDANALIAFCSKEISKGKNTSGQSIGIFCDERNPILNKNIAYSVMFGEPQILTNCYEKVKESEIRDYYSLSQQLSEVFQSGKCKDEEQQRKLREFQNLKNRIELLDVMIYTDIVNDFMSQLVSWAYLRERDFMYYQLGVHYLRLFNSDCISADSKYRVLKGADINILDGALLYQIVAMYTHELPLYAVKDGVAVRAKKQGSAGAKIVGFISEYCEESMKDAPTYLRGLELFEDVGRHDDFSKFRNDIAHMRYMATQEESIMEMMSKVYNGFFIYDSKLKKSVSFIFKNILMRYFVVANTEMRHMDHDHNDPLLHLKEKDGLTSDQFTYKFENGKQCKIDVRNKTFLKQLEKLLYYKSDKKQA